MKTTLPLSKQIFRSLLVGCTLFTSVFATAQSGNGGQQSIPELVFKNATRESGSAGADGTVYRFSNVTSNVDALVTIAGRSSSLVTLSTIDRTGTGYDNAFQPEVSYNNGNASSNRNWWMDFDVRFVTKDGNTPVTVNEFKVTALDVDGDGSRLREYVGFYNAQSYILENNTQLSVQNIVATIFGLLTPGRQFDGPTTNYNNIDVTATRVMTTLGYTNKSNFRVRAGGATGNGSSSAASRMYSFWFKGFSYTAPVQSTLPVKLMSFNATLGTNKVDLKWVTAEEKNVSHFEVEKSTDGKTFSSIGVVFAFGNSAEVRNYAFTDNNVNSSKDGVIYYRLRSVDVDTKSELSQVRMIHLSKRAGAELSLLTYPNPASSDLRVTIPAQWQGKKVAYEVISQNGQVLISTQNAAASQTENLNISKLPTGYYAVRASCNGETAQQKIIKQ